LGVLASHNVAHARCDLRLMYWSVLAGGEGSFG
jgi:hypothetical protein